MVVFSDKNCLSQLEPVLRSAEITKYLLVCDSAYPHLTFSRNLDDLPFPRTIFQEFTPNPKYEDVCRATALFRESGCDGIIAVGGGSAMDVAKCVKLFSALNADENYLQQPFRGSGIPLLAMPTTAGTGSESTHFAVIYQHGVKQSVAHQSMLPDWVFLDASALESLPLFQKKCTLLDALCQGMESWWSVRATPESIGHARTAVQGIVQNMDAYLASWNEAAARRILLAANHAGQAINITQTTAPHAMSYKLTSLYGIPHGYAVALCFPKVWRYMIENPQACAHPQGQEGLKAVFCDIAQALGYRDAETAINGFEDMLSRLGITRPCALQKDDWDILKRSVNAQRLGNNPIFLSEGVLYNLYRQIVKQGA